MKAVIVNEIGSFKIMAVQVPEPGDGEVLIETAVTGLCRTDLKIIEVGHRDLILPRVPGEELVGTICAVGRGVASEFIGHRVYVYPGTSCGMCKACLQGAENLCHDMRIMGFHRDGGFAEYVIAPLKSTIRIPDGCPFDHAVTAEPLSCCLNALELASIQPTDKIGIWGGGPAGAFLSRAAAAFGAKVTVIEPHLERHKYHKHVYCEPGGLFFDIAVVAIGSAQAYHEALTHLNPRGRLIIFSGLGKEHSAQIVDFNDIHYGEKSVVGAYGCSFRHGVQALELIHSGKVAVEDLISHRMPLEDLGEALDIVRNRSGMKILLYP
jgi:L-iditol 2-dehydrogenase